MIQLIDNLDYRGRSANFDRDDFETLYEMKHYPDHSLSDGQLSYCKEDKTYYIYNRDNDCDPTTGRWRVFAGTLKGLLDSEKVVDYKHQCPELLADKAIADEEGNRISTTYITKIAAKNYITDIYDELFINNPPKIIGGYITPDMLSEATRELLGSDVVNNLPDEEDLTVIHGVLKFANKRYDPNYYSGYGRQFLRKNMINGRNVLVQSMICCDNTFYFVQYDYDLKGATIEMPKNSILIFLGGSITNGVIIGDDTIITGILPKITAKMEGTFISTNTGATASRPTNMAIGFCYFDFDLNKPVWWNGTEWVDSNGQKA